MLYKMTDENGFRILRGKVRKEIKNENTHLGMQLDSGKNNQKPEYFVNKKILLELCTKNF